MEKRVSQLYFPFMKARVIIQVDSEDYQCEQPVPAGTEAGDAFDLAIARARTKFKDPDSFMIRLNKTESVMKDRKLSPGDTLHVSRAEWRELLEQRLGGP